MKTTSQMTLWRMGAVCVGAAISIYALETIDTRAVPIAQLTIIEFVLFSLFMVGQLAMMWGMFFSSGPKSQVIANRLMDAAPALLGSVIGGSYIISITGTFEYFLLPLGIVAFALLKVLARHTWKALRTKATN